MTYRNILLLLLLTFTLYLNLLAAPARPGSKLIANQPDGTTIELKVVGDEFHHYYLTSDNLIVIGIDDRYCYANVDENGNFVNTDILAHEPSARIASEVKLTQLINTEQVHNALYHTTSTIQREVPQSGIGLDPYTCFPSKGTVKALVFLVEYEDVHFSTENAVEYFNNMINQPGFSESNATGSCRDYFIENSMEQFSPQFDVYGPIELPNTRKYYGENNSSGSDKRPQYMMLHAARILDEEVDFSQYDTDNDGYVDNVFIFYAGMGENAGEVSTAVWPHSWEASFADTFDDVKFRHYACAPELIKANMPDGIGTFVHEFSHVLGLPDLYNVSDPYGNYTPGDWSVLDNGCYLNNSRTPPAYSAFERNALGWLDESITLIQQPTSCTLYDIKKSNQAYIIGTNNENEFFLLENRQKDGWDSYLPYHGMLIWHIDYNAHKWYSNNVNSDINHQYVDLIEACNSLYSNRLGQRRYPFPGYNRITEFRFGGSPSFESWAGENLGLDISHITETDEVIRFDVAGGEIDPDGIHSIANDNQYCKVDGNSIYIKADGFISVLNSSGQLIGQGKNAITIVNLPAGIYIVNTPSKATKVAITK